MSEPGFFTYCANCGRRVTPDGCRRCATCKDCRVATCADAECPLTPSRPASQAAAMTLTVYLSDGGTLAIENFDLTTAMDLIDTVSDPDAGPFATFEMDGALVYVRTSHIVRIDMEN